ncbi:MAG: biosynthetic peptidoglycan transglycosylase [Myxococcales bacterium]
MLTSEDARFFAHGALDLKEMSEAIQDRIEEGRPLRGASTLTQQVAKNLYFGNDRSFLRKAKEAYVAYRMEEALSKRRILRLYLNVAEWGPGGVFGIEAAAQAHLKKHASELTLAEGAALAAMLPNPLRFTPQAPKVLRRRASHVLDRCLEDHVASAEEVASAKAELDRWLGTEEVAAED